MTAPSSNNDARFLPLQFLLKVSKFCNLRCRYCYEFEHLANRDLMEEKELRTSIQSISDFLLGSAGRNYYPTFVIHGGEPLLLGKKYFAKLSAIFRSELSSKSIPYALSVQTNLYKIDLELLQDIRFNGISVGVSHDVWGAERLTVAGHNSAIRVKKNIEQLLESGIDFGGVAVLTIDNIAGALDTYRYYSSIGKTVQFIPAFWQPYMQDEQRPLSPSADAILSAFKSISSEQLESRDNVLAYPVYDYMMAAIRSIRGETAWSFDPRLSEWCLVVDTNLDVYTYGDSYTKHGFLGNLGVEPFSILMSPNRRRVAIAHRLQRMRACTACEHRMTCNRIPVAENHASDIRETSCAIAKPMISWFKQLFRTTPEAAETVLLQRLARNAVSITYS